MQVIREKGAETLIEENLRERGWNLADFGTIQKGYKLPSGNEADYVLLLSENPVAILEAKRPGKDLNAALEQARGYAEELKQMGIEIGLLFASDGYLWLRQNLAARTLPERLQRFPTPAEFRAFFNPQSKRLFATLRPYQRVAVSQVFGAVQNTRQKMYLHMATASGKTVVAAGIIAKLFEEGLARRFLFLVDRDALAEQTVKHFKSYLGDNFAIARMTGESAERYKDILVATVQFLAVGEKYRRYPSNFFDVVFLDECHRSYFGDWHPLLEHFRSGGGRLIGLTATPSDKETQNTDEYFTDTNQPRGPVYRYTYRQGVRDGILADCVHYKFLTNVDLSGVHDMGFDFEPDALGRTVDVPQRNELIAEKYFEIIGGKDPVKTIVFTASIPHANNLRYALIRKFNALHDLPPNHSAAESFIVTIHNQIAGAGDLIKEFAKPLTGESRHRIVEQAVHGKLTALRPLVAVSVEMLSTGVDAPDIDALIMARPTKSKVLYVQMKGRGTRKCEETGKEFFKLVDFVDLARIEEVVTNDTVGVEDEPEEVYGVKPLEEMGEAETPERTAIETIKHRQEMIIADVPVWLVTTQVIAPETVEELKPQIEAQLARLTDRTTLIERLKQAILAWRYFRGDTAVDPFYLETMGFALSILRDLFGEVDATLEEFVAVAEGNADFGFLRERRRLREFAKSRKLSAEQAELLLMLWDFKRANSDLSVTQLFRSQVLQSKGGVHVIERLFGSMGSYLGLYQEARDEVGK